MRDKKGERERREEIGRIKVNISQEERNIIGVEVE
jgi:hypothetical protein